QILEAGWNIHPHRDRGHDHDGLTCDEYCWHDCCRGHAASQSHLRESRVRWIAAESASVHFCSEMESGDRK
ncbi:hypothetical protein PFISCL1PPCAC_18136, partial [Pristionchus fissidentatus]